MILISAAAAADRSIDVASDLTGGFAARFIRGKARRLARHAAFRGQDAEDLQQDLSLAVWQAASSFDPGIGDWEAFVATVVERRAAQLLIALRTEKRLAGQAAQSLDVTVTDGDGLEVSFASQIPEEQRAALTRSLTDQDRVELRLDLETLLESLPDDDRQLLRDLAEHSQREVAAARGVSRRTIRDALGRARQRIAAAHAAFGTCPKRSARAAAVRKA
ncbi:MAG: sigma-70 family RNA polymerase sigma factor [Planctomycetaceae bacterium]